jgi:hypothetical protein
MHPLGGGLRNDLKVGSYDDISFTIHYGKIEQFWYRQDAPGVIFLMNVESVEQAKATVEALPLAAGGYAKYDFMQVGPLAPLSLLIQGK